MKRKTGKLGKPQADNHLGGRFEKIFENIGKSETLSVKMIKEL